MKFRMVDQILSFTPGRCIRGAKTVSFEEYTAGDALGMAAQLPPTLTLESLVQLGSWLIVLSTDFQELGVLESLEGARFSAALGPGERMLIDVTVAEWDDAVTFTGTGRSGRGEVIACEQWRMTRRSLNQYHSSADLRVLFSEIYRGEEAAL